MYFPQLIYYLADYSNVSFRKVPGNASRETKQLIKEKLKKRHFPYLKILLTFLGLDSPQHCLVLGCGANLKPSDADFVDAIHTTFISGPSPQGHADFYPNGPHSCLLLVTGPSRAFSK